MLNAIFAGVSGLRNEQLGMDVIGNNIANINTMGFKAGRARFQEQFSQLLQAGSPGGNGLGGTNPVQLGLGSQVAGIDNLFTQGNLQTTGLGTDLALQGDGFFILGNGQSNVYSRAGAFSFDANGNLVDPSSGLIVQGYAADSSGNIAPGTALAGIQIPLDANAPAKPTANLVLNGNLDSTAPGGTKYDVTTTVYDSLGNKQTVTLEFTKAADTPGSAGPPPVPPTPNPNQWDVAVVAPTAGVANDASTPTTSIGTLKFNADGTLDWANTVASLKDITITPTPANGASPVVLKFGEVTPPATAPATSAGNPFASLTQTAGESNAFVFSQDGYAAGSITKTSVDLQGHIVASFSNGVTRTLAQVAVARFANDEGLTKADGSTYSESLNSGRAVVGQAGSGPFGTIAAGALEGSNVDLAQEFTNLIVAQRGFQANAKMITTGDEMLTDVVNIKR